MRIIQVGLGPWGLDWARQVVPGVDRVTVVGRVDNDTASRRKAAEALDEAESLYYGSLSEALSAVDAQAVLATVPLAGHVAVVKEALAADKHVLVEKPFTDTVAEARRLVDLADARGRVLMVSQNYRHYPAPLAAAEFVAERRFGALRSVDVDFRHNAESLDYRYYDLAQPLLSDMAIHHFDLMRMVIGGEPETMECRTRTPDGSRFAGPPAAEARLEFGNGTVVTYSGSWVSEDPPTPWAGEWRMEFDDAEIWWTSRGSKGQRDERDRLIVLGNGDAAGPARLTPPPYLDRAGCLAAFAAAVADGTEAPHFSSGRDNIGSIAMVEAAVRSAARNSRIAMAEVGSRG